MRKLKMTLIIFLAIIATWTLVLYFATDRIAQFGATPKGERLERILKSPNYDGTSFVNQHNVVLSFSFSDYMTMFKRLIFGDEQRHPDINIPVNRLTTADFSNADKDQLYVTWMGHSSVLLELDGRRILTDPVWSERTSPISFMGPSRFHPIPIELEQLPEIDIVIISHDHYDHLDKDAVQFLANKGVTILTTLGVGAHLESWAIDPKQIVELDWWDEYKIDDSFTIACTPAQHFSGRSWFGKRNQSLWSTWAIVGSKQRVFFCGDTGEMPEFEDIGQKYGPFDLTLMKIGAYGENWPDIHLTPEQTIRLHQKLQGKLLVPIHWGSFNLALHSWDEPIRQLVAQSNQAHINYVTPYPGQRFSLDALPRVDRWWEKKEPL